MILSLCISFAARQCSDTKRVATPWCALLAMAATLVGAPAAVRCETPAPMVAASAPGLPALPLDVAGLPLRVGMSHAETRQIVPAVSSLQRGPMAGLAFVRGRLDADGADYLLLLQFYRTRSTFESLSRIDVGSTGDYVLGATLLYLSFESDEARARFSTKERARLAAQLGQERCGHHPLDKEPSAYFQTPAGGRTGGAHVTSEVTTDMGRLPGNRPPLATQWMLLVHRTDVALPAPAC